MSETTENFVSAGETPAELPAYKSALLEDLEEAMRDVVKDLQGAGVRVSIFVDPEPAAVRWAASLGADRVELYTEPYAIAFAAGRESFEVAFYFDRD